MGIWSTKLYGNDTTSDIRDTYIDYLHKTLNDEDAYNMTYDDYRELIGSDEEPLFWFALADTQWRLGRLSPTVKLNALKFIGDFQNALPDEWNEKQVASWKNMLNNLSMQLASPMPQPKKISPPPVFDRSPWNIGDLYGYRFHSAKSKKFDLFGKYIVFQKIGEAQSYDNLTFSVVQIYNKVYSSCPILSDVHGVDILPLVYPPNVEGTPNNIEDYLPSFEWFRKAIMLFGTPSDYPKKHLTFIGNSSLEHKRYLGNQCTSIFWESTGMEEWIIDFYSEWRKHGDNKTGDG